MSIINTLKPNTSLSNTGKPNMGEIWATIDTTWATETNTWREVSQLINNVTRVTPSITNINKPA